MAPAPHVCVAVCQLARCSGGSQPTWAPSRPRSGRAAGNGAQVVVLPELVTTGYVFESAQEARGLAEPADGPSLRAITALALELDLVIVGGFAELAADDAVHNSAFLIDRSGVRAVYRKAHLWADEHRWFTPGQEPPAVVDTDLGCIGILVCYDLEFPEWTRIAALAGADLLCVPTNWPAAPFSAVSVRSRWSVPRPAPRSTGSSSPPAIGWVWSGARTGSAVRPSSARTDTRSPWPNRAVDHRP